MSCDCGSINLPIGKKYNSNGLYLKINQDILDLVHDRDFILERGEIFVSNTTKCNIQDSININSFSLCWNSAEYGIIYNGPIQIVISDFSNNFILCSQIVHKKTSLISIECILEKPIQYNLFNKRLKISIYSICEQLNDISCIPCRKLPSIQSVNGYPNEIIYFKNTDVTLNVPCCN